MQGGEAVLAMSSRTWISYYYSNRFHLTPLSYETLEYAAGFSSEQCPEGIVAISTNTLRYLFCDSPLFVLVCSLASSLAVCVAELGCLSRIRIFYISDPGSKFFSSPDPNFFHPGSRIRA
jgi:hypothetical protein